MRTIKLFLFFFISMSVTQYSNGQTPIIEWQHNFGGTANDFFLSSTLTSDSGYIMIGSSYSSTLAVHGSCDFYVVKLDNNGNLEWQKSYGGTSGDIGYSIKQTPDMGYILAGFTSSNDGDVTGAKGNFDAWIVKIDSIGIIEWQKCYGGSDLDDVENITLTSDGGYIFAGSTMSIDGDIINMHPNGWYSEAWIVKLDSIGNLEWSKCYGGFNYEKFLTIKQTFDGGYIAVGVTASNDGDVNGFIGFDDAWIVKIDNIGTMEWQKCFGGTHYDIANDVIETSDGGYVICGDTRSTDGDIDTSFGGMFDTWVIKLSNTGALEWKQILGSVSDDYLKSIQQTLDGGFITVGYSLYQPINYLNDDVWVVKLSQQGSFQWYKCFGGNSVDWGNSIHQTQDGGFFIAGRSKSNNCDLTNNNGGEDGWVFKLSQDFSSIDNYTSFNNIKIFSNPIHNQLIFQVNSEMIGETYQIYSISGKCEISGLIESEIIKVNVNFLKKGLYFIGTKNRLYQLKKIMIN